LAELDPAIVEAARQIIAQAEQTKKVDIRQVQHERVQQALEMAWTRTQGEPNQLDAAVNLFERWCESDSQMRDGLLKPLIREAIELRLAAIPKAEPKLV
jgi:hypothetical protein